ncbi:MAG: rRNA pseudouridine synthase [Candidatus Kerfeldbacteria bacterium]|nr:rRNA pseudouridine synthase [Candidatus Kerfeldbacteria bacterium]
MTSLRLNKYIANHSQYARRHVDELIARGRVTVDGAVATLGQKVDDTTQPHITVNGKVLLAETKPLTYLMLNKPKEYVVTRAEFETEQSVMQLLPENLRHLRPVGRLDKNSEGLVLFTDDGELIQQLTHPSFQHDKEYIVTVKSPLLESDVQAWADGILLGEGNTGKNTSIKQLDDFTFTIILKQGWNRQIRRMVEARGNRVRNLQRIRVGNAQLGNLPVGKWQVIQRAEIC